MNTAEARGRRQSDIKLGRNVCGDGRAHDGGSARSESHLRDLGQSPDKAKWEGTRVREFAANLGRRIRLPTRRSPEPRVICCICCGGSRNTVNSSQQVIPSPVDPSPTAGISPSFLRMLCPLDLALTFLLANISRLCWPGVVFIARCLHWHTLPMPALTAPPSMDANCGCAS